MTCPAPSSRLYRVAPITWRRRTSTPAHRVRGSASILIMELGMVIHGVGITIRAADGTIDISMPARSTVAPDTDHELAVEFRDNRSHNTFAKRVWDAILGAFPDAETCPVGIKQVRKRTSGANHD